MKNSFLFLILFFTFSSFSLAQEVYLLPDTFKTALKDGKMMFTKPLGTTEIPRVKNRQMHYEYALKFKDKPIEIRYSISPLKKRMIEYRESQTNKRPGQRLIDPNTTAKAIAYSVALNVAGGQMDTTIRPIPFAPEAVKGEFGADWGSTTLITLKNNSFGTKLTHCIMVTLHKNDIADAYIFYLGDSKEVLWQFLQENTTLQGPFYALRFEP